MQKNVLEYLENSAKRCPDKTAFSDGSGEITFSELLAAAKSIGTEIAKKTDKIKKPIAVITGRNFHSIAAFMGVLFSGNFYVPIDMDMPKARLDAVFEKLSPEMVLYTSGEKGDFEGYETLEYDISKRDFSDDLLLKRRERVLDKDPVYIIYTSGSTGVPKGIVISHAAVIDFVDWMTGLGFSGDDIFANQAPFYFDCSVKDLYMTLKLGATDHIIPKKLFMFPTLLIDFMNEKKVTAITWATSGFNLVSASGILEKKIPEYLRLVAIGGEAMLAKHLNNWRKALPKTKFVNLYGPTEVTVDCTYFEVLGEFRDFDAIPIGRACENKEVMLLDDSLNEVPDGTPGEICVRGTGISHGYYNEPEKTAAAFVQNPNVPYYDIIYKTGDIGIKNKDGNIVFQARKDGQIKHMGYRIELGEIERAVNSLEEIIDAICFYDNARDRICCVYEGDIEGRAIAKAVSAIIPKYMIPNIYRRVEKMPHNANSKIDRVRLKKEYEDEENK